jgi:hypothetical protein
VIYNVAPLQQSLNLDLFLVGELAFAAERQCLRQWLPGTKNTPHPRLQQGRIVPLELFYSVLNQVIHLLKLLSGPSLQVVLRLIEVGKYDVLTHEVIRYLLGKDKLAELMCQASGQETGRGNMTRNKKRQPRSRREDNKKRPRLRGRLLEIAGLVLLKRIRNQRRQVPKESYNQKGWPGGAR